MSSPPEKRPEYVERTEGFLRALGLFGPLPDAANRKDFYSDLLRGLLRADRAERGRVTCSLSVNPALTNAYNTLHGGALGGIAVTVATACARTVVGGDKDLFLGESSFSYLSAARIDDEVEVDSLVLRQGRSVIVTTVEFRNKKTRKLLYISHATFYVTPVASL